MVNDPKNSLSFAVNYHPGMFLPVLMIGVSLSYVRAKVAHFSALLQQCVLYAL